MGWRGRVCVCAVRCDAVRYGARVCARAREKAFRPTYVMYCKRAGTRGEPTIKAIKRKWRGGGEGSEREGGLAKRGTTG